MKDFTAPTVLSALGLVIMFCSGQPRFDADRAFMDLEKICSYGPRISDTEAHLKAGEYIFNSMKETTDICRIQRFSIYDSVFNTNRNMFNIIASYYPKSAKRVMLCAHWDSRPVSDMEGDSSKMHLPVPGANDGASGTAVLMEFGRILKKHKPPVGVDIVFFDGEDYGSDEWLSGWFLGSMHFTEQMAGYRPRLALLIDMVGDKDLQIYREVISEKYARDLNDYIWRIAAEQGSAAFIDSAKHTISDDHVALLSRGIKSIDIIDFDYPYWHTQQDTPDRCSAESLGEVGRILVAAIYDERIRDF
ncbi:MAG: M28 family peptidase [Candidatus Zixiibacteriota bacterium]|nr:MAG: M28 family peptidase [candidate division Zixibacteria bacterium]